MFHQRLRNFHFWKRKWRKHSSHAQDVWAFIENDHLGEWNPWSFSVKVCYSCRVSTISLRNMKLIILLLAAKLIYRYIGLWWFLLIPSKQYSSYSFWKDQLEWISTFERGWNSCPSIPHIGISFTRITFKFILIYLRSFVFVHFS